jgi:hypothetical protein
MQPPSNVPDLDAPARLLSELVASLESQGLRYAILRNYEQFPHLGHDLDLVMDSRDIGRFRDIAIALAEKRGWDALTECDHWSQSGVRNHNIEVFRFYCTRPLCFLQVDLFHGFNVWGLPLLNERQMLQGRRHSGDRLFTRIDPAGENLQRMLQIHSLAGQRDSARKVERYRQRVIDFCSAGNSGFQRLLQRTFFVFGKRALEALKAGDRKGFAASMRLGKVCFCVRFLVRHPVLATRSLLARLVDHARLFRTRQCGFVLRAHASSDAHWRRLQEALEHLRAANVLRRWTDRNGQSGRIGREERQVMERGGVVIKRCRRQGAHIEVDGLQTQQDIALAITRFLVRRHDLLFFREAKAT